ncbi:Uncharacterized protein Fot_12768 [Forsythia ovata]|uniref:Uncharacterized protein n=1 Tax=Forsythia ovata TaxID=205694 RepID=A0ABD1W229_9LAMI
MSPATSTCHRPTAKPPSPHPYPTLFSLLLDLLDNHRVDNTRQPPRQDKGKKNLQGTQIWLLAANSSAPMCILRGVFGQMWERRERRLALPYFLFFYIRAIVFVKRVPALVERDRIAGVVW